MLPAAHPKQYPDVKATVAWYTGIISGLTALVLYLFFIPEAQRTALGDLFSRIPSEEIVGSGLIFVVFGLVGWFLIFFLEIHDKVYDQYIIKWRFYYDLDFILPRLFRPLAGNMDPRFFASAQAAKSAFMEPYYKFVGDFAEHKINENLILRFYEASTKYWITQMHELLLFAILIFTYAYYFVYKNLELPLDAIVITNIVVVTLMVINRYLVRLSRNQVRLKTTDEIADIHEKFPVELENELEALHQQHGLQYRRADGEKPDVAD